MCSRCSHFFRYPFEWRTPIGYIGCVLIQIPTLFVDAEFYVSTLNLIIGCCAFISSLVSDLKEEIRQFNVRLIELKSKKKSSEREVAELKKELNKIIQFYVDSRE